MGGFVIGRGRNGRETYPTSAGAGGSGGSAVTALQNRNVAADTALVAPFTPSGGVLAAVLFTPKVSGVIQIAASLAAVNSSGSADVDVAELAIQQGTGLNVTGGATTVNGWHMGSTVAPTVTGVFGATPLILEDLANTVGSGDSGTFLMFGVSTPLPVGVPVVIALTLNGSKSLSQLTITNLSVYELP